MLDPKLLRESPETVRTAIARKHLDVDLDAVLALDNEWRKQLAEVEALRGRQKAANNEMAALKKGSPEFIAKVAEMRGVSVQVRAGEEAIKPLEEKLHAAMLSLPNIPHSTVPDGKTPEQNVVHATHGAVDATSKLAIPHWEIGGFGNLIDFPRGAKVTGAGFPFFIGEGAKLSRALLQFFLDEDVKAGYTEVSPPIFVNAASATATGQLPDKEGQMYETLDKLYAVPTAEVPLTNFFRDEILEEAALPVYRCAYTPCFRREAGSYGKDVRGLNRVHQFDKVELLKWVHPFSSYDELEKLRADAERLLQKLELPYRVLLMCGGDLGFAQSKKYDLEVWAAGQKRWLEVSSCSNFESFQARRAQIRFRNQETGKPELVHTLNGSGLAVPRVLAALLENNLQADGRVKLPAALVPYFGKEFVSFK
ncbi:MAG: serine--tRNA ligase [Opitutaceae bacterium]|nr:serine--tRNA ligase [Opitutaceae bacterium]